MSNIHIRGEKIDAKSLKKQYQIMNISKITDIYSVIDKLMNRSHKLLKSIIDYKNILDVMLFYTKYCRIFLTNFVNKV